MSLSFSHTHIHTVSSGRFTTSGPVDILKCFILILLMGLQCMRMCFLLVLLYFLDKHNDSFLWPTGSASARQKQRRWQTLHFSGRPASHMFVASVGIVSKKFQCTHKHIHTHTHTQQSIHTHTQLPGYCESNSQTTSPTFLSFGPELVSKPHLEFKHSKDSDNYV